jgi:copper oxidase (laccase) domain-containing protein
MIKKGCKLKNITAVIGPSISVKNYEVGEQFKDRFIKKDKMNIKFFKKEKNKIYFDLPNYVKKQVKLNQIKNIDLLNIDTFNKKNNFFSARRSLKLNHNDYGRNISVIMIN